MEKIKETMILELDNASSSKELNDLKIKYLGKKGIITLLYGKMKDLDSDSKKNFGKNINELKSIFNDTFDVLKVKFYEEELSKKLLSEKIDISLPGVCVDSGAPHMLDKVVEQVEEFYISMGFDVVEGPEVEKDLYNFEMLNLPKGHPARDAQDTFYIKGDEWLLRSQTSPVQVRTMLAGKGKSPIRIICPGKTYRRDYDDATHSHQFMQIEGLVVDKDISLAHLKGILDKMASHIFGEGCVTRFRPSFYPFTEPSVEYDVSCFKCGGKGCNVCKGTSWITIGGAGIVHPNVLEMSGYDPKEWTGFAFGFGVERITMVKYGIPDIRYFYTNDLRINKEFERLGD